jgi:hypothetical protein
MGHRFRAARAQVINCSEWQTSRARAERARASRLPHLQLAAAGSRSDARRCVQVPVFAAARVPEGGAAAMDRVGSGEKQLEDCTVAKSVWSPPLSPLPDSPN